MFYEVTSEPWTKVNALVQFVSKHAAALLNVHETEDLRAEILTTSLDSLEITGLSVLKSNSFCWSKNKICIKAHLLNKF
jgi:hypothetical protein